MLGRFGTGVQRLPHCSRMYLPAADRLTVQSRWILQQDIVTLFLHYKPGIVASLVYTEGSLNCPSNARDSYAFYMGIAHYPMSRRDDYI